MNSALLREHFAIPDHVSFQDVAPEYPVLDIRNPHATARIAVHGAQVLSFQPEGEEDLLWVSKTAVFAEGTSVRGGIPICWPWFGKHPTKDMPSHGFARNRFWTLCAVEQQDDGRTVVTFSLEDDEQSRAIWPHAFQLQLQVSVGRSLSLALTMRNKAAETVDLTMALHTYFSTGDIAQTAVRGLDGRVYIDALQDWQRFRQAGDVRFDGELDRIYQDSSGDELIKDEARHRAVQLQKTNSNSTVVWNPWVAKSSRMADFEEGGYRRMVCVETGNMGDDVISLAPDASHTLGVNYRILDLQKTPL